MTDEESIVDRSEFVRGGGDGVIRQPTELFGENHLGVDVQQRLQGLGEILRQLTAKIEVFDRLSQEFLVGTTRPGAGRGPQG